MTQHEAIVMHEPFPPTPSNAPEPGSAALDRAHAPWDRDEEARESGSRFTLGAGHPDPSYDAYAPPSEPAEAEPAGEDRTSPDVQGFQPAEELFFASPAIDDTPSFPGAALLPASLSPRVSRSEHSRRVPVASSGPPAVLAAAPAAGARGKMAILVPVLCLLATVAGVGAGTKLTASKQAAPIATISAAISEIHGAEEGERAELTRQAAALAETRDEVQRVSKRQDAAEQASKDERARVDAEQARLAKEIAATRRAQAKSDEHVYQIGEALKLIDWATTGGSASASLERSKKSAP